MKITCGCIGFLSGWAHECWCDAEFMLKSLRDEGYWAHAEMEEAHDYGSGWKWVTAAKQIWQ